MFTFLSFLLFLDVDDGLAKCLLHVYVDSCQELKAPKTAKRTSKPSPEVELKVGNGEPQTTFQQHYSEDPAFEQGFVFTVINPHSDDLHIKVIGNLQFSTPDGVSNLFFNLYKQGNCM